MSEGGVAANARREDVASLSLLFDQHPSRVRCWTCFERHVPEHAVAFMDEVGQREPRMRKLLHVVRERSHARQHLLSVVLMRKARGHLLASLAVRGIQLRLEQERRLAS